MFPVGGQTDGTLAPDVDGGGAFGVQTWKPGGVEVSI